eukprot:TRINITY_DN4608_c0_g1_i4.p1 TRINITY_DN4608_c0_g1~~TRINITY_DN4608_c0_g1_i4.p1  ORF type:complete len:555 (+),score=95.81 TRINITY_DN4608_c0_g1_i4:209-1873(+)
MSNFLPTYDFELYGTVLSIGATIMLVGLTREILSTKLPASDIMVCTAIGIILGPFVSRAINPFSWSSSTFLNQMGEPQIAVPMLHKFTSEIMRVILAVQLVALGLSLPTRYLQKGRRTQAILLTIVMVAMWVTSSAIIYVAFLIPFADQPSLSWWESFLIGACITPTDPVVSSAITSSVLAKRTLPLRLRNTIGAESGLNDGLGYPFVMLCLLYITQTDSSAGVILAQFMYQVVLYQIVAAVLIGIVLGFLVGKLLKWAEPAKLHDQQLLVALAVAFAFLYVGLFRLLNMDELLSVLVGALMYAYVIEGPRRVNETQLQETVDLLFSSVGFVYFGLIIPWSSWSSTIGPARASVLVIGVLLLRRLPWVMAMQPWLAPQVRTRLDAAFVGWFGPVGIGAIFYANFAVSQTGDQKVWNIVSLVVFTSVMAFGLSDTLLTKLYGRLQPRTPLTLLQPPSPQHASVPRGEGTLRSIATSRFSPFRQPDYEPQTEWVQLKDMNSDAQAGERLPREMHRHEEEEEDEDDQEEEEVEEEDVPTVTPESTSTISTQDHYTST